ncbi:MAG TPA: ribosome-associated translation inhibitor RaiA [Natronosporangium sp.]|nr:ribosome-associated translation inhibitor RaiA [Natronosporangium sp.]
MEIIVKGRNVEVPDHYRVHVAEKLEKAVRLDPKIINVDVELTHEKNPRQQDHCQRVEITCRSRGPVVRAESSARDFYTALDEAVDRLTIRLQRAVDRRRVRRPRRGPASLADLPTDPALEASALAAQEELAAVDPETGERSTAVVTDEGAPVTEPGEQALDDQPWRIVREKEHPGDPMTVEDALFQMELVGHDFYLFQDKETGRPSVVYRRRGYDYGVISLAEPATRS